MDLLLVGAVLVFLGVSGSASPPAEGSPAPRDAARFAVEMYNQETETPAVFKLLKIRNTHKTRFDWGVHFSLNFTIKETSCRKTRTGYKPVNCKYNPNGQAGAKKSSSPSKPQASVPRIHVEHYMPSAYITAAQMAMEVE